MEWTNDWIPCVERCHAHLPMASRLQLIEQLRTLESNSLANHPIRSIIEPDGTAVYSVIYPGRLAGIGGFAIANSGDEATRVDRLTRLLELVLASLSGEVEVVQAITPEPLFPSDADRIRDQAYRVAGLRQVAELQQMDVSLLGAYGNRQREPDDRHPSDHGSDSPELGYDRLSQLLSFRPWSESQQVGFQSILDRTYEGTLDVPELNGVRTTEQTLIGYESSLEGDEHPWWLIENANGQRVGCLLLCPHGRRLIELVYLGIVPEHRGQGYARAILMFAHRWAMSQGAERMFLAVDRRNVAAKKLYSRFGYEVLSQVSAWFWSPK